MLMSASHRHASGVRSILRRLNASSQDLQSSAAMTPDGFIIASVLSSQVDEDRFAAMSASLLALAERAAEEISRGQLKQLMIEGDWGVMLLVRAGKDAVLAVVAKPSINLGKIFLEARRTAAEIQTLFDT